MKTASRGKTGTIALAMVVDESGSMTSCRDETIAGINEYLGDARREGLDYRVYLTKFDHEYRPLHAGAKIADVPDIDQASYEPRGYTALYDAIGKTIRQVDELGLDKVVFVIVTDGAENASHEFAFSDVKGLIDDRTAKGWAFAFIGAHPDAYDTGVSIGISNSARYHATDVGTTVTWRALAGSRRRHSAAASMGLTGDLLAASAMLTPEEREKLEHTT